MQKTLLALLTTSLIGCMASGTVRTRSEPPPPPPRDSVRVVEPPHRDEPPPPPHREREPRVIEGRVLDADTHEPISRAAIDITSPSFAGQRTVNTDADGRYRTEEIPRGEFGLRCRREGYEVFERKAVMGDGIARIDFELRRKRR
jgi:protocatechuate 3,4-dioxygenase beta subunit